jgi:UDP:flavonoid glycosyltransferase YjiC (YdhE family)
VRVLVTTCPAPSHLFPLVPLAWALRCAGHEVLVPVPPTLSATATATGLPTIGVRDVDMNEVMERNFARLVRDGLPASDPRQQAKCAAKGFAELAERVCDDVVGICRDWRPDLVVHDSIEFAGPLAARVLGVPAIAVGWGTWLKPPVLTLVHDELRPFYAAYGVDPAAIEPAGRVDVCPQALREDAEQAVIDARFEPYNGSRPTPRHLLAPDGRRRICVTLGGSVGSNPRMRTAVLEPVLAGLGQVAAEVVVALGDVEAAELAPQADNITIERWLPLNQILPACDLIVHHAGAGTSMTAARFGVPQLVFPHLADQFRFAAKLCEAGAAKRLDDTTLTPDGVRDAARELLDNDGVREAAARLAKEISAAPAVTELVPFAERVGATR